MSADVLEKLPESSVAPEHDEKVTVESPEDVPHGGDREDAEGG